MLPFMKRTQDAAAAGPVTKIERKPDEGSEPEYDALESAAEDLRTGIEKKDSKMIAAALRAAFQMLDSEPHEEGPHT